MQAYTLSPYCNIHSRYTVNSAGIVLWFCTNTLILGVKKTYLKQDLRVHKMQVRRFDLTVVDYSKMSKKNTDEKITYYDSDLGSSATTKGKYNEGLSRTPISSDTDLTNIVIEAKEDINLATMSVFIDGDLVHVPNLGVRHSKVELTTALEEYYSTKVVLRGSCFHREMSEVEHKVNDVLHTVQTMDPKLCFQRMQPSCFYEIKGSNEIDVFLTIDDVLDWNKFTIEEITDLEGCVRIRQIDTPSNLMSSDFRLTEGRLGAESSQTRSPLVGFCIKSTSGPGYLSAKAIGSHFKDLVVKSFQCLPREWRDSWPECKLNSQVHKQDFAALERSISFQKYFMSKRVSFQDSQRCIVNLIPTLTCRNYWPRSPKWSELSATVWPDHAVLNHIMEQGVHLVAMPTEMDREDVWRIKFFYGQRLLNNQTTAAQCKQKCLRIIKVLCEHELGFSRYFVPSFLENLALQLHEQNPENGDWTNDMLPVRFLEFLVKIYEALKTRKCMHFFLPKINILLGIPDRYASRLARKVQGILIDPFKYLGPRTNGDLLMS